MSGKLLNLPSRSCYMICTENSHRCLKAIVEQNAGIWFIPVFWRMTASKSSKQKMSLWRTGNRQIDRHIQLFMHSCWSRFLHGSWTNSVANISGKICHSFALPINWLEKIYLTIKSKPLATTGNIYTSHNCV